MKKFLMAVLLCIPIVVVLSLSATGTIIAAAKDVNATALLVRDADYNEMATNSTIYMDISDSYTTIYIDVLPNITYDDSVTYEMSADESFVGEVSMARVQDTNEYRIYPVVSGASKVIIRASNNREVYFSLNIYIYSDDVENIIIYDNFGTTISDDMTASSKAEYSLTTSTTLYALCYPLDAVDSQQVYWSSSDESVVSVSENGTITPCKMGEAIITATIIQKNGVALSTQIVVDTSDAVLKTTELYVSGTIDEQYIADNVVINVTDNDLLKTLEIEQVSGGYMVTLGSNSEMLYVYETTENTFDFYDIPEVVYTNGGSYSVSCCLLEDVEKVALSGVTYEIVADNMGIASLYNGKLDVYQSGEITLVATYNGESVSKVIQIYEKPLTFTLSLGQEDGELGIEMTRVWGFNWYTDTTYTTTTNTYQLSTDIVEGTTDLRWTSSNDEWATVDETGLIVFNTAGAGQSITITAEVYAYNYPTGVSRSFTFNMTEEINSYNVGTYTTNDDAEKDENALAVYATARLNLWGNTVVLQGNVNFATTIYISASIYGNGFTIDAQNIAGEDTIDTVMLYTKKDGSDLMERDAYYIQNLTLSGAANYEESGSFGYGMRIEVGEYETKIVYSTIRYVDLGVMVATVNTDVLFDGCILGDGLYSAVEITTKEGRIDNTITFNNCVFKETGGPSMVVSSANPLNVSEYLNINALPYLVFSGFTDIYNWKKVSDLVEVVGSIGSALGSIDDVGIDPSIITNMLGTIFTEVFMQEQNSSAIYYYESEDGTVEPYISLGMIALGAYVDNDISRVTIEDEGLELVSIQMPDENDKSDIANLLRIAQVAGQIATGDSTFTVSHDSQLITYNLDADGGPRNEPEDPVPQNTELYYKLTGQEEPTTNKGQTLTPEVIAL